ncbi:MAG: T9SS type A sorting domain-containing protein [Bacteroidales bacterium]|nr:T9SS type A sorting domain-containing protein [Candidatus Colimorpha pelethequi]
MYVTAPVGTDYQWIDGNTYTNDNNSASVMMHTIHGCDSLVRLNLRFTSEGIDALSGNQQITLMPNPTTSHVTVVCDELVHCIEVMDLQGRSVMKVQDVTDRASLSLGNLSRGTYLVKVVTQSGVAMRKLILE